MRRLQCPPRTPAHARVQRRLTEPGPRLVRRARKIDRVLAETYPDARCELDFDNPFELLVVTVLSAQTTDRRVNAVRPALFAAYPDATAMAARRPGQARADHPADRLLPGQDRVAAQAVAGARRAARRRGAAAARGPRDAARRGPQDRQRRARQRVRHPGHHRRHPLRPAGPPLRLDRRDRPGQGRARGRGAVPEEGLDDAVPPPDLARPAASATPATPPAAPARSPSSCPAYGEGPTDPVKAAKLVRTEGRA